MRLIPAFFLLSICLAAQPSIRSAEHSSQFSTTAATASLHGVASSDAPLANVYWIDQQGQRGPAQWNLAAPGAEANWTVEVALRSGPNHITVVAVDSRNRTAGTQFSVYRDAAAGPQVSAVGAGWYHGIPVTYAVVNGLALLDGDIILGTAEQLAASAPMGPGVGQYGFSDGYVVQLWPQTGGVYQIPYTIENSAPNLNAALTYVNSILSGIIQFVPQTNQANYVTFNFTTDFPTGVCESSVGMVGGQQFVTGSVDCAVGTLVHEMGHTIGLLHEHQRPDRNTFITFTPANADKPWIAGNFDFFSYDYQTIGLYDYASVMHYPPFSFTKNNLPVLESIPAGMPLSNTVGYSAGDIDTIERLYGFAPAEVTVTTNPAGLQIVVDSTTYTAPHTFNWPLNSKHTLSLPPDPQYTNPADGSTYEFGNWNDLGARSHTVANGGGSGLLTSPATKPAVTVYEANFIRLQPFASSASPAGSGTVSVAPAPQSLFGGSFFVDRQAITLTAAPNAGYNFYGWFGPPYPQGGDPYSFLIQSPQSTLQGAFTPYPVTVIGESITGPNFWNPPMFGYVDNAFTDLPQGYSQDEWGSAWAPGTSHSINAPSPDVPVTTNVSYLWNSWSDGGAQTHQITASSAGVENIAASFTPTYRSYALVENTCGGTVSYSQSCPNNDCSFPDGTLLTMTATPATGSGMVFSGWTGDLSGTTNPQTTTVHDEFLPVANFNLVPTVITAATVSPAAPVKSANAATLTVTGTGFVKNSFYTYWNNSYRSNTVTNADKATIQLNAGDLANAGSQLLQVSNFSTSGCGAVALTQVLVKNTPGTPRLAITKSHQGNFTQGETNATYTVTVSNPSSSTGPTAGKVTVTDTIPTGLTLVSMAGTGWTCTANSCSRTSPLAPGKSYPAITVTVDVAANAPGSVTNTATVSGGKSPAATASDPTTIN